MPCTLRNGVYQWNVCKQNDLWSLILQGHSAYTHWRLDGIQCLFLHHQWRFAFRNDEGGEGKSAGVFLSPNYITENINGDVCVSDLFRRALIVTDKFNEERFSYGEKKGSMVFANAVVTDILGHMVVCVRMKIRFISWILMVNCLDFFPKQRTYFFVPEVYTLISRTTYSETSKMILL